MSEGAAGPQPGGVTVTDSEPRGVGARLIHSLTHSPVAGVATRLRRAGVACQ